MITLIDWQVSRVTSPCFHLLLIFLNNTRWILLWLFVFVFFFSLNIKLDFNILLLDIYCYEGQKQVFRVDGDDCYGKVIFFILLLWWRYINSIENISVFFFFQKMSTIYETELLIDILWIVLFCNNCNRKLDLFYFYFFV